MPAGAGTGSPASATNWPRAQLAELRGVFRAGLGVNALGEEGQDSVGDLLGVLRMWVVARVIDHRVTTDPGW